jgi:sugar/nucleoside kinase (ribokinase family)
MNNHNTEKVVSLFEDKAFREEVREMISNKQPSERVTEILEKIVSGTSSSEDVLEELIKEAHDHGYQVDMTLSQAFFVLSEISTLKKEYRDLALDASVMLGEDDESRVEREFNPMTRLTEIKSTTVF